MLYNPFRDVTPCTRTGAVCGSSSASARRKKKRPWPGTPTPGASSRQGIPREFTTKSRVAIISNDWQTLNKNVAALQDRGHVLLFQPMAAEVHQMAGTWFDDQEIYGWFATNLHRVREPSLRHYVRAKELRRAAGQSLPENPNRSTHSWESKRAPNYRRFSYDAVWYHLPVCVDLFGFPA